MQKMRKKSKFSFGFMVSILVHIGVIALMLTTTLNYDKKPKTIVKLVPKTIEGNKDEEIVRASTIAKKDIDAAIERQKNVERNKKIKEDKLRKEAVAKAKAMSESMEMLAKKEQQIIAKQKQIEIENNKLVKEQKLARKKEADLKKKMEKIKKQEQEKLSQVTKAKKQQEKIKQAAIEKEKIAKQQKLASQKRNRWIESEVARYSSEIKMAIEDNRNFSLALPKTTSCVLRLKLLPDGSILNISVQQSSGNLAYDELQETAIYKSAPFEMPEDFEVTNRLRDIVFTFYNGEVA